MASVIVPRQRSRRAATSSQSWALAKAVKPERSANRTVTGRRSPSAPPTSVVERAFAAALPGVHSWSVSGRPWAVRIGSIVGATAGASRAPHLGQKAKSGGQAKSQAGQAVASLLPHLGQKANSAAALNP